MAFEPNLRTNVTQDTSPSAPLPNPKRRRVFGWAVAIIAAVAIITVLWNVGRDDRRGRESAALSGLSSNPQAYYGQTISVRGPVNDVLAPHVFAVGGPDPSTQVIIIAQTTPAPSKGRLVRVSGTVRALRTDDLQRETGVSLDKDRLVAWTNRPVIVAKDVAPLRAE